VLCGADNSCLMHLDGILRRQDAPLRTVHLAEILASTESLPYQPSQPLPAAETEKIR
jgi:L-lactate dehydrogenase complex protein LldE